MYFLQSIALFGRFVLLKVLLGFRVKLGKADWEKLIQWVSTNRSSPPEGFLGKYAANLQEITLAIKFSIKLQSNFIEITLWHG